jgi:large subunit ribosomal protein L19
VSVASLYDLCGLCGYETSCLDEVEKVFEMSQQILELVEKSSLKADIPEFNVGDTVDVHTKILEGDKERIQVFTGVVIARSGSGSRETFTVRRIVANEGVERKFPIHSPRIDKIEVKRSGVVRRAKLYFLRGRTGKSTRLKERRREEVEQN